MSKTPYFKFYPNDFLGGVAYLTFEERGAFITLLCHQWDSGPIPKKRLGFLLGFGWEKVWDSISSKFEETPDGMIFSRRLEFEREKARQFSDKQTINGKKGGRPKTQTKPKQNPNIYPKKSLLDNDNDNDNDNEYKGGVGENLQPREYLATASGKHNLQFIHKNSNLPKSDFDHLVEQFILSREEDSTKQYKDQKQILAGLQKYINSASRNYHERKQRSNGKPTGDKLLEWYGES
jgi:uncharacterized protein YdaU (DUF1376 family)